MGLICENLRDFSPCGVSKVCNREAGRSSSVSWLKTALSEKGRIRHNILRYRKLIKKLDAIKRILFATQSNAYFMVREVLEDTLVKANKDIASRLSCGRSGKPQNRSWARWRPSLCDRQWH